MADFFSFSPQGFAMLRRIKADPMFNPAEGEELKLVLYLHRAGLITDFIPSHGRRLTPEGEEALRLEDERLAAAQQAAKDAENERARQKAEADAAKAEERSHLDQQTKQQFRHDWRIAIFELVGGFVLGAVADHFFDIVGNTARTVVAALTALGLLH